MRDVDQNLPDEVKKVLSEPELKSVSEEMESRGQTEIDVKKDEVSDQGEFEKKVLQGILTEEIFSKAGLDLREKQVLRKFFLEGFTIDDIAHQIKSNSAAGHISTDSVQMIKNEAIRKLQSFLPRSTEKELDREMNRELTKVLVLKYLYPKDKNKFLIIEHLLNHFAKNGFSEFSPEEQEALFYMRTWSRDGVLSNLSSFLQDTDKPKRAQKIFDSTLEKVRQIVERFK